MSTSNDIHLTTRKAAVVLRDMQIPYALAGGMAAWARGGVEVGHDVDFVVLPEDAERALAALESAGFRGERPPEHWLYKAWNGDVLVDIIFEMSGRPTGPMIERSQEMSVMSITMPVMTSDDVMIAKLNALSERNMAFEGSLAMARAVREQIDWEWVRTQTKDSPFAVAFLALVDELGITTSSRSL